MQVSSRVAIRPASAENDEAGRKVPFSDSTTMARPRTVSDEAILEAVGRAVSRVGPAAVGVRDIAAESGLAASTLIQRFGSRQQLLRSYAEARARRGPEAFERPRAGSDPLENLERALVEVIDPHLTPEASAHLLALEQMFLAEPPFRDHAARQARRVRREIRRLLKKAIKKKLLRPGTDVRGLGRTLHLMLRGCLASWPLYRRKSLQAWVQREVRDTLAAHLRR
jgi:AcrR family transcriptional regulator